MLAMTRTDQCRISREGQPLKPPMGYGSYARMTAGDVDAIVAYLRTVPPKE